MYHRTLKLFHKIKLHDFQYKINNKILVTNSFLYKINKTDNLACSYRGEQPEKIHHLFLRCPRVKTFWIELNPSPAELILPNVVSLLNCFM